MKTSITLLLAASLGLCGCALFNSKPGAAPSALTNPNNLAKAAQDSITVAAAAFLANNPSYEPQLASAANALAALATSNPALLSGQDVAAALARTSIDPKTASSIAAGVTAALGIFRTDLQAQLPTLKAPYALFLTAAANGLYQATGQPALPLPTVP